MKSTFEEMGGTYIRVGDYFIPDLVLDDAPEYQIGKYGRMRERYLKEHRRTAYAKLKLSGKLDEHLAETDQTCNEPNGLQVSRGDPPELTGGRKCWPINEILN